MIDYIRELCDDEIKSAFKDIVVHDVSSAWDAGYLACLSDVFCILNDLEYYKKAKDASNKVWEEADF